MAIRTARMKIRPNANVALLKFGATVKTPYRRLTSLPTGSAINYGISKQAIISFVATYRMAYLNCHMCQATRIVRTSAPRAGVRVYIGLDKAYPGNPGSGAHRTGEGDSRSGARREEHRRALTTLYCDKTPVGNAYYKGG